MEDDDELGDLPADLRRFIDEGMGDDDRASFDREAWRDAPRIDGGFDDEGTGWGSYGDELRGYQEESGDD